MPGVAFADSVAVANYTAAPLTFHLYGADAINARGGGLSVRRRTDTQTDMGTWIELPYPELTVPARGASVVPFTILPPPQATPGDHVGGIVAEETQGTTSRSIPLPITVLQAVGVHVYSSVVGPLQSQLAVGRMSLSLGSSVATQFGGSGGRSRPVHRRQSGLTRSSRRSPPSKTDDTVGHSRPTNPHDRSTSPRQCVGLRGRTSPG